MTKKIGKYYNNEIEQQKAIDNIYVQLLKHSKDKKKVNTVIPLIDKLDIEAKNQHIRIIYNKINRLFLFFKKLKNAPIETQKLIIETFLYSIDNRRYNIKNIIGDRECYRGEDYKFINKVLNQLYLKIVKEKIREFSELLYKEKGVRLRF